MTTLQFIEQDNVVEIRYEGLNATQLAALTTRVDELEDLVEAGGGETGVAIVDLQNDVDALQASVAAVESGLADEIARATAAEAVLSDTITDTFDDIQDDIADAVAAEAALRVTGDSDEAAARDAAIAAAVDPLTDEVASLSSAVGSLSSDVVAAQAAIADVVTDLATETAARIAGDATNAGDIDDLVTALFDETTAREAFQATLGGATYITVDDETAAFVNSRKLVAGTGVTFDDTTPGELEISASGGGGGSSPLTTKGDLYTYDTADARLPIGSDGQVLVADSGEPTGMKWDTPAGGGGGGSSLAFAQTLVETGDEIANNATETDFIATYPIGAGILSAEGSVLEAKYFGIINTDASVAPDITFRVKMGGTTILDSGPVTLATGITNKGWTIDALSITNGNFNEIEAQGVLHVFGMGSISMENTAPVSVVLGSASNLTLSVEWSTADADNAVQLRAEIVRISYADDTSNTIVLPLARTNLLHERTNGAASSSFTPPNNCLLVAVLGVCQASGASDPSGDLGISGGSLTWTPQVNDGSAISYSRGVRIFTAPVTTGTSMTVTPVLGGGRSIFTLDVDVFAYENYNVGSPVGAVASSHTMASGAGPQTMTLSANPASSSEVIAVMHTNPTAAGPINPDTGWTEQYEIEASSVGMQTQTRAGSTSDQVSWNGVGSTYNNENCAAAIEIKRA